MIAGAVRITRSLIATIGVAIMLALLVVAFTVVAIVFSLIAAWIGI